MNHKATILIADDWSDNVDLVRDLLAPEGYNILGAYNGGEALTSTREHLPDLVILDIEMPIMDGYEVCEQLKADPATENIPVLMLTARSKPDQRVKGLKLGAEDYLAKPFDYNELVARVEARLRTKRQADQLRAAQTAIRDTFARYVSPHVVERLLADPDRVRLGGTLQTITVLFADLRGYTALAETLPPEQLVDVLNGYLTVASQAILAHDGTTSQYAGDLVMAIFNAPLPQSDHALRAVQAALELQREMIRHQLQLPQHLRLDFGLGIATGEAVVGNIGAREWLTYTAIGDTVNLAKRLEEIAHGGEILMTEGTRQAVDKAAQTEHKGDVQVRGRREPVRVYALVDLDVGGSQ